MKKYILGLLILNVGFLTAMKQEQKATLPIKQTKTVLFKSFAKNLLKKIGNVMYQFNTDYAELVENMQEVINGQYTPNK